MGHQKNNFVLTWDGIGGSGEDGARAGGGEREIHIQDVWGHTYHNFAKSSV